MMTSLDATEMDTTVQTTTKMNRQIAVLGSCMIDYVSYATRLPKRGETLKGTSFITNQGGKGANICMAAAKMGGNTSLIARLGDDHYGLQYLEILKSYNIDTKHTFITEGVTSGVAQIMVDETAGDNIIVIVPGANNCLSEKDLVEADTLLSCAHVLVCQLETPINITISALRQFKGLSILNTAPAVKNIDPELRELTSIVVMNETEASIMTGLPNETLADSKLAVEALLKQGWKTVILTCGDQGAMFASQDKPDVTYVSTTQVAAVDATGAGDAFVGSLAYLIAEKPEFSLDVQIQIACQLASYSVQSCGTHKSYADAAMLEKCLADYELATQ